MKKINKLFVPLLSAVFIFGCSNNTSNTPHPINTINESLNQIVNYGDSFTVPSDYKIVYENVEYTPTATYLEYPDGKTYSGKTFVINQYGQYTIIYEANVDGKFINGKQTFRVGKELYNFNMTGSTLEYGDLYASFQQSGFLKGLKLNMVEGDTFVYNKPINVYESEVVNLISFNVVQFEPTVKNVNVRLTDCYDPSIYMDLNYVMGNYSYECYLNAGSCSTGQLGLIESSSGLISIGDKKYNTNGTGTSIAGPISINGTINSVSFYFDNSNEGCPRIYGETDRQYKYSLIREFNNSQVSTSVFPGFTNGYVYLTLTASGFNGVEKAPIQIGQINGIRDKNLLPYEFYEDKLPPVIDIDISSKNIEIVAGKTIKIPSAVAKDDSGLKGECSTTVWFNYDDPNGRILISPTLSSDGIHYEFNPDKIGQYTIEYTAYDVFNNKTTELVRLAASKSRVNPINFSYNPIEDNIEAGNKIKLNDYTITSLNNDALVTITVTLPSGDNYVLPTVNEFYTLEEVGKYKVTYNYFDSFYSGSSSYEFNVKASSKPVFEMDLIPTSGYLIKGATYSLENVNAYMFTSNGKVKQELVGYVKYGDSDFVSTGFNKDEFKVDTNESKVRFKLACKDYPDVEIMSYVNKVVDVNYSSNQINLGNYFYTPHSFITETTVDYITYKYNDTRNSSYLTFINKLGFEGFRLRFASEEGKAPEKVEITLTDYYDELNSHNFAFTDSYCQIDGGAYIPLSVNWKAGAFLDLSYSKDKINIGSESIILPNDFTNNLLKLDISLSGISKGSIFNISNVNNQVFNSSVKMDGVKPVILVNYPSRVTTTSDTVTLNNPVFYDVLSPSPSNKGNLTVTYMNYKGDAENVVTTDGITLRNIKDFNKKYSFNTKEYGQYIITYTYLDGKNNKITNEGNINVIDTIAPTISFEKNSDSCGVGPIKFQSFIASDNVTAIEDLEVWYIVYSKSGIFAGAVLSSSEDQVNINEKGDYIVYGYCIDKEGNTSYASYDLKVN